MTLYPHIRHRKSTSIENWKIPPKNDDAIYEQALAVLLQVLGSYIVCITYDHTKNIPNRHHQLLPIYFCRWWGPTPILSHHSLPASSSSLFGSGEEILICFFPHFVSFCVIIWRCVMNFILFIFFAFALKRVVEPLRQLSIMEVR